MRIVHALGAVLLLLVWRSLFAGWIFDDSYIAFRFSSNWAEGHGLTWNPGEDPVEGFTSFAWVLLGAFVQRVLGAPPHVAMVFAGVASWLVLMLFLLPRMIRTVTGAAVSASFAGLLAALALSANPFLAFNAFHGLETALHALVLAAAAYLALQDPTVRNQAALAATSLFSFMVRPDALAFLLPLWGVRLVFSGNQRRKVIAGFLAFLVALGIYTVVKWQWFGHPLPNTFYIKQGGLLSGLGYVKDYLLILAPLWLFCAFAAGRATVSRLLKDRVFLTLLLPAAAFCLAYVKLNPILGQGFRFLVPTLALIVLACLRACVLSGCRGEAFAAYALAILLTGGAFGVRMYREYGGLRSYFAAIDRTLVAAGRNLERAGSLSPAPLLATGDVGAIPYFSGLPTMDLIGLADETIAHDGLTHAYISRRNPDLLILQDLHLRREGEPYELDLSRYRGILDAPERAHSGAGSTYQVVTTPSFAARYRHVAEWDFAGIDRYHVFVRGDYARFDELAGILRQGR